MKKLLVNWHRLRNLSTIFTLLFILIVSCKNFPLTEVSTETFEQTLQTDSVRFEKNYLVFRSFSAYINTLTVVQTYDSKKYREWSSNLQFSTMWNLFNEITQAETEILSKENLTDEQTLSLKQHGYLSEIAAKHAHFLTFSLETGIALNLFSPAASLLLNEDGIVKIGNNLYQFGKQTVKIIKNGDESSIQGLDKIVVSTENVSVCKVTWVGSNKGVDSGTASSQWTRSCSNDNGKYRIYGYADWLIYYDPYVGNVYTLSINISSLKKGFLGYYYSYSDNLCENGSANVYNSSFSLLTTLNMTYPGCSVPYSPPGPSTTLPYQQSYIQTVINPSTTPDSMDASISYQSSNCNCTVNY